MPLFTFPIQFCIDLRIESSLLVSGTCRVKLLPGCPLVNIEYHNHHHHRQHYIGDKRPILHCHTTIRGRKYLAVVLEGVGFGLKHWKLVYQTATKVPTPWSKQTIMQNAEYRRGQDIISETVSLQLSLPQRHYKPYCPYDTAQHSPYTP